MLLNVRVDVDVRNLSMVMEEMKLVDVHHTTLIKNFTIIKGTVVVAIYMKLIRLSKSWLILSILHALNWSKGWKNLLVISRI